MSHSRTLLTSRHSWPLVLSVLCVGALIIVAHSAAHYWTRPDQSGTGIVPLDSVRRLSLLTKDLIVDSSTETIYASVPGSGGLAANSITQIDPLSGVIGTSIPVGSDPGKLAISDNRQFIYVGLDGEAAVRRFDIATQTAQLHITLGNSPFSGPYYVDDMEVLPGAPQSVAISRRRDNTTSQRHEGVVIFDNDVQRPTVTDRNVARNNSIEFSNSSATLYGFNNEDTGLQLYRLSVTATGVSVAGQIPGLLNQFGNIKFDAGLLYHTAGRVVDPEANKIIGEYTGMNLSPFITAASVVVDSANNRVYFLAGGGVNTGSSGTARIYTFDKSTFSLLSSTTVTGTIGPIGGLVQWGPNSLAFRDDGTVYLLSPSGSPSPTPSPTPTPTPAPTPLPGELRQIALLTRDLVVEPNSQKIYASIPGSAGAIGNSLTAIDPVSGMVGASVPIGSEPNKLAVTDNGQYIYAGLDGVASVRRFDVAAQTAGTQFSITANAVDIATQPGSPDTIAVVRNQSLPELLIYDVGVPRPLTKSGGVTRLAFSNSPAVLYGYNTDVSSFDFSKMVVASCGVGQAKAIRQLITGNNYDIKYDNGRVYSAGGRVIDPDAGVLVGTFFVPGPGFALVETDSKANRIYSLTGDGSSAVLRVFDMQTFALVGALSLPGVTGIPSSLVRWGTNGLAFNTPTAVYLLQDALVAGPSPSFTPAPTASPSTFTVSGKVLELNTPVSGVTISFSGLQSGTTQTDVSGNYAIGNLPLCGTLTVTASKANYTFTPSSVVITNPATQTANFSAFHRIIGFVTDHIAVNEGANLLFLPISRSAGLPPTTTDISYATHSGTASDRSDYTSAFGTFHFDTITSQAPLQIPITNDVFVEGPETFTVTLDPVPGFDLVNPTVTVTIVDDDVSPPVTNPLQDARFFVRRQYHDFLNREPDTAGLNFWTGQINVCNNETDPQKKGDCFEEQHINVSAAFFFSIEFQSTGYLVNRLYAVSFPDSPRGLPRFEEFLRDTHDIGRGVVVGQADWQASLEQNTLDFLRRWIDRTEFRAQYPDALSSGQYVDALFAHGGVVPTIAERAAAISVFGSGGSEGRALALRNVAESKSVFNKQYNSALVLMQYFGYLRRNPNDPPEATLDFAGYDFWLHKLNDFTLPGEDASDGSIALSRVRRAQMVKAFLVSSEYMGRVGPLTFNIRQ